ncbi:MAG: ABC transporter permease [Methylococcales bacterium]|nr:ABC transporter permease [Methylococcales bacterium]
MSVSENPSNQFRANLQHGVLEIDMSGDWLLDGVLPVSDALLTRIRTDKTITGIRFLTRDLGRWDSLLVTELIQILDCAAKQSVDVDKASLPVAIQGLLTLAQSVPERAGARRSYRSVPWAEAAVAGLAHIGLHAKKMLTFVGELAISMVSVLSGKQRFRHRDLWLCIQECGPSALPIVSLVSLLVGLILAFVGALELSLFGAQIYISNLVSLGMTREMGGLMTAIIMSGRTGAAYAAQLGAMHVNDEIDALKTMNLEPMSFLVIPRMFALILIMPLLCLYADLMGMVGGGLVTVSLFDVSLTEYLNRSAHAVQLKDFLVGFVKCSVFGVLIALSGCMRGMQCGRSASAVGDAATSAVVTSIVFIVIADSVMTIICNRVGI